MNAPEGFFLADVQASPDQRRLAIQKVGVKDLRYPLALLDADGRTQHTATIAMSVGLRPERGAIGIDELVRLAEEEASCEIFGLLKRPDEKWVTERAYGNPKFVEDLVRDIALRLQAETRIGAWSIASENFESIHNHSAYAELAGVNR